MSTAGAWDLDADVVVIGGGCAGLAAAIEAARAGARTVVLERSSGTGGASALSGGEIYLGGGTATQAACGFDDTPEEMEKFLTAALGPGVDAAKVRAYCAGSVDLHDWLVGLGIVFKPSLWDEPAWVPRTDDGLMWLGENTHPFSSLAVPAPRGHRPQGRNYVGWVLMDALERALRREPLAAVEADVTARRLVTEAGRVTGVEGRRLGRDLRVRARRGVVVATGGYVYNDAMLAEHNPELVGTGKIGTDADDGSGITMAQAVGAATRRMGSAEAALWTSPALLYRSLLVNEHGQRFINEDTYPGRTGQFALFGERGQVFLVLDEETFEGVPSKSRLGLRPTWVGETVQELEELAGFPPGSLEATVGLYNRHAEHGRDPVFHKRPEFVKPLRPPFAVIDARGGGDAGDIERGDAAGGFLTFTLGGLATSPDGEVLDGTGRPLPGLFAAGRATSGLPAAGYISGTSLGDGLFFGRAAGRRAAAVAPPDETGPRA